MTTTTQPSEATVQEPSSHRLFAKLVRTADRQNIPLTASIELTQRCNLACVHCYNFDRSRPLSRDSLAQELQPSEIYDIIDQLAEAGCLFLSFTGGEALMHPHLNDFVVHARSRHFVVKIKTNGATLTERKVGQLAAAQVAGFDISLYGADASTHDAFTLVDGSFDRTMEGIRHARRSGIPVRVNMCATRHNADQIERMIEMAESRGCGVGVTPFLTARYDGTDSSLDHRVERKQLERIYSGPLRDFLPKPDFDPKRSVQCGCARTNCGISATGDVYPCIGAPIPSGNLRRQSFAEIWKDSPELNRIRRLELEDFRSCVTCPTRPSCMRSSGVVYSNTGNYTGAESFTCMDAEVRMAVHRERTSATSGDPE